MSDFADKIKGMQIQPSLLVEQVTKALTDAILQGVFKGGDQLIESELQKQFGISRSPIRETFRILEKHGLVVVSPRKGTFVKKVTQTDVEQHFPIRACLEGLAAALAATRLSPQDIQTMTEALSEMESATAQQDHHTYRQHHVRFHETFIHASGNDALVDLLKHLRQHEVWFRLTYFYVGSRHDSIRIHKAILDALVAGNGKQAQDLVKDHIMDTSDDFLSSLPKDQKKVPGP
jgi:DNA-binding GntR family transcriptional regulator